MTAAHKYLPFGTMAKVCLDSGACVTVRITDRGPFVPGRIVDLSAAAHDALGMGGLAHVTMTPLGIQVQKVIESWTETVVETPKPAPTPARASRSEARTRIVAGEAHVERAIAPAAKRVTVKTAAVAAPVGSFTTHTETPATALAPLAMLAAFGAFRGKFRLELDETLALPEDK